MPPTLRTFVLLLGLALLVPVAHAEDDPETARLRDALRQTAARLQETESQLEQAQLATTAAERERDAFKQAAPAAKKDDARTMALQHQLAASSAELSQARADGQKYQSAQHASEQLAQKSDAERNALAGELAKLRARMQQCAANDDALYRTGSEIAAMYRDPDFVNRLRDLHVWPLGFSRVKQENRMRSLEDGFADEHAQAQACRSGTAAAAAAPASVGAAPATKPVAEPAPVSEAQPSPSQAPAGSSEAP